MTIHPYVRRSRVRRNPVHHETNIPRRPRERGDLIHREINIPRRSRERGNPVAQQRLSALER